MKSKQEQAKEAQGFQSRSNTCGTCAYFSSVITQEQDPFARGTWWTKETNMRCNLGGFKVGKSNVCLMFVRKDVT